MVLYPSSPQLFFSPPPGSVHPRRHVLPGQEERSLVLDGLKQIFHQRDFVLLLLIFFVGLGVFNAVTTWIEDCQTARLFHHPGRKYGRLDDCRGSYGPPGYPLALRPLS